MASFAKSRFNHLFATPHKRQFCYESLSVADGSQIRSDGGTSLSASTKFLAYPDKSGGGSTVAVLPLTSYGRRHVPTTSATYQQPLYKIHTSKVHCVSFSPHDQTDTLLASGSSGGAVHVYKVPEEGLVEDQTGSSDQSSIVATSTESTVHGVVWHPSCSNVLGVQHPKSIEVMDVHTQKSIWSTDAHLQDVHSFAWGWDGKTAVTTSKDKIVRLFDSRTGSISDSTVGHGSWRPSIAAWAGRVDYFYTTGVGSDRSREIKVWDIRNMKKGALVTHRIDSGSSVLIPKVDVDTGLLYVTSRGDTGFRILEWKAGASKIKEIKHCRLNGDPVLDVCLLPKSTLDVVGCEMARLLRLTQGSIDPVRVELPRKDKSKIDTEIYIDTDARVASMDVASFLAAATGDDVAAPTLVSVVDAVTSLNQGSSKKKKKMTESTTSSTSTAQESSTSTPQGETKGVTTTEEDQAADRRRQKATSAFGGQSKYKYIRCDAPGERNVDKTWYNLKMDTSDTNSMLIAASKEHFVVPWQSGGGGPMYVGELSKPGKSASGNNVKTLKGHKERVNALAFNPHDDNILASGSDDADIRLWRLESGGVGGECVNTLGGHIRSIRALLWNPNCNNVLASSSSDNTVRLWDASSSEDAKVTIDVGEAPLSMCYNYKGDGLAVAGRKRVVFVDPRTGGDPHTTIKETHQGSKGQRIVWLRDQNYLFTVGSTKAAAREFKIWDVRNPGGKALSAITIDRGAGMLNPFYDEDTNLIYLASKGESSIHVYDMDGVSSTVKPRECSKASVPGAIMCGMCVLPKNTCQVQDTQVLRGLHASSTSVQTITFKVPRAAKLAQYFHDDLYPATRDLSNVTMDASAYFDALDVAVPEVNTVSLRPKDMPLLSEKPKDVVKSSRPKASTYLAAQRKEEERLRAKDEQFQRLEALAHQHARYNANNSMGSRKIKGERDRVAARDDDNDDSSDSGWSDED